MSSVKAIVIPAGDDGYWRDPKFDIVLSKGKCFIHGSGLTAAGPAIRHGPTLRLLFLSMEYVGIRKVAF